MEKSKIVSALQDLIIRLKDAEKGYEEIEKATSNATLRNWFRRFANERHNMHRALEDHVKSLGEVAEVKTSFLGTLHRMFIDIKLNAMDDNLDAIVNEIERGATTLLDDYNKVLSEVEMPAHMVSTLATQKATIDFELKNLNKLRDEYNAVSV